ncbi:rhodanese-related sulfurtransferase [Mucilaginibacter yixingensis]|uniref:Rhodanese-related sulfurtransferase n=1 Tax=Mucilaginibacter yixingensis TaxID=1295612 RepID=A0A2T5JGB2_9SPHI|nr:rhodanese-like domain-containing protein [Mucilaginibacter yixingensis]PTR01472.1 rhodanese-related sulfurtransferase [Mucilaginibacter yixingensis]
MKTIKLGLLALFISVGSVYAQTAGKQTNKITINEFESKLKAAGNNAQILDARSAEEYAQNHIKGAVSFDAKAAGYAQQLAALSKDKPTFVYSIANGRSSVLSAELREKGFKQVYELPGGLANWVGSGYPVVSNTKKGLSLSASQYQQLAASAPQVLIDFGSRYCGACKKLVPVLDSLKSTQGFAPKIVSIEQYDNTALARNLKVNVLPTLIYYQNGKEVWRKQGFSSTEQLKNAVAKAR